MKERFAKIKKFLLPVGVALVILLMVAFAEQEHESVMYSGIDIRIFPENAQSFVNKEKIEKYIYANTDSVKINSKPLNEIDIDRLEKLVEADPYIENAEVYTGSDGVLHIEVSQRNPVCRVMKNDGTGFYIDVNGVKFPVAEYKPTRVLVVSGVVAEPFSANDSVRDAGNEERLLFLPLCG